LQPLGSYCRNVGRFKDDLGIRETLNKKEKKT